jgi:small-conductance mechanosensitive channel
VLTSLLLAIGTGLCVLSAQAQQTAPHEPVEAEIVTAPVDVDGTVLFHVRGVSSLPAEERARRIHDQIIAAAGDRRVAPEAVRIIEGDAAHRIQAGDRVIMAVLDADAKMEQVDRHALAMAHLYRIQQAIANYRAERTTARLRGDVLRILAALLILAATVVLLGWFWRWIDRVLVARLRARIQTVQFHSFEVIRAEQIWDAVRGTIVALRAVVVLAAVLICLGYVLAQLPWTRSLSSSMAEFALAPLTRIGHGIVTNIPNVVFLAVLFVVFRLVLRVVKLFFSGIEEGAVTFTGFQPEWAQPTYKIVRVAIIAFGFILAYPYIPGSDSAAFQGVSLFVGLLFSLGSSSVISNIIAGYAMIYRRAFKIGDRIKVGNNVGEVMETRLQVTHLRSLKNEEIIIPNSQILSAEVLNYSSLAANGGVILHTEVGIGYDVSWRQVEAMLIEAAHRTQDLGTDPRPYVLEKQLGDFAVVYELNVHCTNIRMMGKLYASLHRHVLDVFNEHGVQIMTPAYEGDPEAPKVVSRGDPQPPPAGRFDTH